MKGKAKRVFAGRQEIRRMSPLCRVSLFEFGANDRERHHEHGSGTTTTGGRMRRPEPYQFTPHDTVIKELVYGSLSGDADTAVHAHDHRARIR